MRRPGTAANSSSTEPATVALASGSPYPRRPPSPPSPPPRQRLQHSSGQVTLPARPIPEDRVPPRRVPKKKPFEGEARPAALLLRLLSVWEPTRRPRASSARSRVAFTYWANVRVPVEKRTTERRLRPFAWPLWRPLETTPRVSAASPRPLFLNAGSLS